jgi:hypothetical protein
MLIMIMEPSHFGSRDHLATLGRLDGPGLWAVHPQGKVSSPAMVRGKGAGQQVLKMALV